MTTLDKLQVIEKNPSFIWSLKRLRALLRTAPSTARLFPIAAIYAAIEELD
jgi:hypothetical protein